MQPLARGLCCPAISRSADLPALQSSFSSCVVLVCLLALLLQVLWRQLVINILDTLEVFDEVCSTQYKKQHMQVDLMRVLSVPQLNSGTVDLGHPLLTNSRLSAHVLEVCWQPETEIGQL